MSESLWRRRLRKAGTKRKARRQRFEPVPEIESVDPLEGVVFGSPEAEELARDQDATFRSFARSSVTPSGVDGYLTKDVRKVLRERG